MPPGLPQGLKSSFYAPSGNSTGSDKLAFFKPLPPTGSSQEAGPHLSGKRSARFTSGVTAGTANSLRRRERESRFGARSDDVTLQGQLVCQEKKGNWLRN